MLDLLYTQKDDYYDTYLINGGFGPDNGDHGSEPTGGDDTAPGGEGDESPEENTSFPQNSSDVTQTDYSS